MIRRSSEKKAQELFSSHINLVCRTISSMTETFTLYCQDNYEKSREKAYETHLNEAEADAIRRKLIELMCGGTFMPMLREDLVSYLARQDKIADHAESICDFLITQHPKIPDRFKKEFIKIAVMGADAAKELQKAMNSFFTDFSAINKHIKKVNSVEEKSDSLEWHLTEKVFKSKKLTLDEKLHIKMLIYQLGLISDSAENAADTLDSMAVKKKS